MSLHRQLHPPPEIPPARIAAQAPNQRIEASENEAGIAIAVAALQPLESLLAVAAPGVDLCDLVSADVGPHGGERLERAPGFGLVSQGVVGQGAAPQPPALGARALHR